MIKTRNLMFAAMSCIATMSLTSCATILSGSANKIYIDEDVDEPVTIVTEKQTYENVELPTMVKINRHGWLVDLATNCVSMPQKKHYDITGKPKNKNL